MDYYIRNVYYYVENGEKKYFTYIGETDKASKIYCGEIGVVDSSRVYIPIIGLNNLVLFTDKLFLVDRNVNSYVFRQKGKPFLLDAHDFSVLINSLCNELLTFYSNSIINISSQNYNSSNNTLKDIAFPEKLIRLLEWNQTKKRLKFDKHSVVSYIARFNIYYAYYGTNIGSEINKLRPVLIWKQHVNPNNPMDNSYFVFPLSSKKGKKKFPYHIELEVNGCKDYVRINDGRRISILRIEKPLKDINTGKTFVVEQNKINEIKDAIKKYFSL